jgi:hypothetical protein
MFERENEARDTGEKKTSASYSCEIQFVCGEDASAEIHKNLGGKIRVDEFISTEVRKKNIRVVQYLTDAKRKQSVLKDRSRRFKCSNGC